MLVGALASSTSHLDDVFEMIVTGAIHPSEVRYVWGAVGRTPAGRAKASAFFRDRFQDLRVALGGVSGLAGSIGWACDEASQRQGTSFFAPKLASFDGMQRAYDEGLEASRSCIATRAKAGPSATAWLAAHPIP